MDHPYGAPDGVPTTLTALIRRLAIVHPTSTVRSATAAVPWRDVPERVAGVAAGLAAWGVAPGDRVALWMRNEIAWLETWFAVAWLGATLVPLNTRLSRSETAFVLRQSRTHWLIWAPGHGDLDGGAIDTMEEAGLTLRGRATVASGGSRSASDVPFERLIGAPIESHEDEAAVGMIQYTSGSTAFPKGAMLRNASLIRNAAGLANAWRLTSADRVLCSNPLFHCGGSVFAFLAGAVNGSDVLLADRWDVERCASLITTEGVTVFPGIDAAVRDLVSLAESTGRAFPTLRLVSTAADTELFRRVVGVLGCEPSNVYGLTESSPNVCVGDLGDPAELRIARIGRPQPGIEVQIRDPATGSLLPPGQVGMIVVRGWSLMMGYFDDPAATAAVIDGDGFLWTGDLGELTVDGYLIYRGRLKEMIKSGGENISIEEVEEALRSHPSVADAVVVPVAHDRFGEVGWAYVHLHQGHHVSGAELAEHCRRLIARFKVPKKFVFVDELPRTGSGKVDRRALAGLAAAEVGVAQ